MPKTKGSLASRTCDEDVRPNWLPDSSFISPLPRFLVLAIVRIVNELLLDDDDSSNHAAFSVMHYVPLACLPGHSPFEQLIQTGLHVLEAVSFPVFLGV